MRYHRMNTGDYATQEFQMCRQKTHAKEIPQPVLSRQDGGDVVAFTRSCKRGKVRGGRLLLEWRFTQAVALVLVY